jgi:hypothetical protein
MSAAERQGVEDQQRRDMQARGVRPVRPEVLAAMIVGSSLVYLRPTQGVLVWHVLTLFPHNQDDLGDVRINDLPLEDRPRNAPVAVCHGHRAAQDRAPMLASRNHWTGRSAHYILARPTFQELTFRYSCNCLGQIPGCRRRSCQRLGSAW